MAPLLSILRFLLTNFLKANDFEKVTELVEKHDADTTHQEQETGARFFKILEAFFYRFLKRSDAGCNSHRLVVFDLYNLQCETLIENKENL